LHAAPDLVGTVAQILRTAPPQQPWFYEGEVRAALRMMACLAGRRWHSADLRAEITIERARKLAGVPDPRPLGWDDQDEVEVRCPWCSAPFTISRHDRYGHGRLFCTDACKVSAEIERKRQRTIAARPERTCPCGATIPPEVNGKRRYCDACSDTVRWPRQREVSRREAA
jgi:hypothetical protein